MNRLARIIRPNIQSLSPYSCARDEFQGEASMLLDANESPYPSAYNRYPDPVQRELKKVIAQLKGISTDQLILGNGSDELIDIIIRTTCQPGKDNMIVFSPGYTMYEVSGKINDVEIRKLLLTEEFQPDWQQMKETIDENTKLVFLCTPNNPVGVEIPLLAIARFAESFDGLVIVDEAYIDFGKQESAINLLQNHPNIVVLQTLSKAWGLAGIRLGMAYGAADLVVILNRVKPPYNVNSLTQDVALKALGRQDQFRARLRTICDQREWLYNQLIGLQLFDRVIPSQGNFILVTTPHFDRLYSYLVQQGVIIRKRNIPPRLVNGLRITIGLPNENERLLELLTQWKNNKL